MSDNNNHFPGLPSLPQRPALNTPPAKPGLGGVPNPTAQTPPRFPSQPQQPAVQQPTSQQSGYVRPNPQQAPSFTQEQPQQQFQQPQPQQWSGQEPQQQPYNNGYTQQAPQQSAPPVSTLFDSAGEEQPKGRSSKLKRKNNSKNLKTAKGSAYSGKRRNVFIARIAIFAILALLVGNGVMNMVPKGSGLTASDGPLIISKVRENLNISDFPRTKGEGTALAFTNTYLNYTPETREERAEALKIFAPEKVLSQNEIRPATEQELTAAGLPVGVDTTVQVVSEGPYVVSSLMFKGGTAALITTMSQINNGEWIYLQIPMYYNKDNGNVTVSGPITFGPPNGTTEVPANETTDTWNDNKEISSSIKEDISTYMIAWAASDTTNIERYLVKEDGKVAATLEARKGLGGSVQVLSVSSLTVQDKKKPEEETAAAMADYNTRQAEVKVMFLDPSSNMVYQQTFRMVLKYVNEDWFVEDIRNTVVALDRDVIIQENSK